MSELSLTEYLKSPCSTASIPYWKQKNITVPNNMKIVHNNDFNADDYIDYIDEPFFRLYHNLKEVKKLNIDGIEIVDATAEMTDILVENINNSYTDLSVSKEQIDSYRKTVAYCPELWVLLKDKKTDIYIGSGIADYDKETGEIILEWIQVLPSYRGLGFGQYIVNYLLAKMQGIAKFATVSGKVSNPASPEKLYSKCGFTGNDIWHILYKK